MNNKAKSKKENVFVKLLILIAIFGILLISSSSFVSSGTQCQCTLNGGECSSGYSCVHKDYCGSTGGLCVKNNCNDPGCTESSACCDQYLCYKSSSNVCHSTENIRCMKSDGTMGNGCGKYGYDVYHRYLQRKCTGSNANCPSSDSWTGWTVKSNCDNNEYCYDPVDAGDPFCTKSPTYFPSETCNNFDDDCDAVVDNGVANCKCNGGSSIKELCNGIDDDCDEMIDEGTVCCSEADSNSQYCKAACDKTPGDNKIGYGSDLFDHETNYGNSNCCGDDANEYYLSNTNGDVACCVYGSDCVASVPAGACYVSNVPSSGGAGGLYLCYNNDWFTCKTDNHVACREVDLWKCTTADGSNWGWYKTSNMPTEINDGNDNDCNGLVDEDPYSYNFGYNTNMDISEIPYLEIKYKVYSNNGVSLFFKPQREDGKISPQQMPSGVGEHMYIVDMNTLKGNDDCESHTGCNSNLITRVDFTAQLVGEESSIDMEIESVSFDNVGSPNFWRPYGDDYSADYYKTHPDEIGEQKVHHEIVFDEAKYGDSSYKVTVDPLESENQFYKGLVSLEIPVEPNTQYTASVWVKAGTISGSASLQIFCHNEVHTEGLAGSGKLNFHYGQEGNGGVYDASDRYLSSNMDWTRKYATFTTLADADHCHILVPFNKPGYGTFWVDGVQFEEGNVATLFNDKGIDPLFTKFEYDDLDRITKITDPLGHSVTTTYGYSR